MVNHPINLTPDVGLGFHDIMEAMPQAMLAPAVVTVRDSGALVLALGQVSPRGTGTQNPENAVDDDAMVKACAITHAAFAVALCR